MLGRKQKGFNVFKQIFRVPTYIKGKEDLGQGQEVYISYAIFTEVLVIISILALSWPEEVLIVEGTIWFS